MHFIWLSTLKYNSDKTESKSIKTRWTVVIQLIRLHSSPLFCKMRNLTRLTALPDHRRSSPKTSAWHKLHQEPAGNSLETLFVSAWQRSQKPRSRTHTMILLIAWNFLTFNLLTTLYVLQYKSSPQAGKAYELLLLIRLQAWDTWDIWSCNVNFT